MSTKRLKPLQIPEEIVPAPDTLYLEGAPLTRDEVFGRLPPAEDAADQKRRDDVWGIIALVFEERRRQTWAIVTPRLSSDTF